jgi:uncharacterized protein (TIGR02145 family)
MKKLVLITVTVFFVQMGNAQTETITDIDGNVYQTVTIGTQKWMKESLKTTKYNNGDSIGTTYPATKDISGESTPKYQWAYAGNDSNIATYGRLYTWYTATDNRKVCPTGWHVPTNAEWITLSNYLGGDVAAQGKLKEADTTHWESPNTGATNESGFTALPGGNRWATGLFVGIGTYSHWWTSTEDASDKSAAWRRILVNDNPADNFQGTADKKIGWAIRCIEDPIPDSAKYFGQTPPGNTAVIFAPNILSLTNRFEAKLVFSPNGKECYFQVFSSDYSISKIYYTEYINNAWTAQVEAQFSVNNNIEAPSMSADGNRLFFAYKNTDKTYDIKMVKRITGGWGEPQLLPSPINSSSDDGGYTETSDSVIYIDSDRPGGYGDEDIWRIRPSSGLAENLGPIMNSSTNDFSPCIAADGSYLIFCSSRINTNGGSLLFISFNKGNNEWTAPVNMNSNGAQVNDNNAFQNGPSLSPDGKYLFFFRHYNLTTMDVYWVSTSIIDTLKKIAFQTSVVNAPKTENLFSVFPNPSEGLFTITLASNLAKNATAEIFTIDGKMRLKQTIWNKSQTIDLADYAKGIYILKITTDSKLFTQKISLK